MDNSVQDGSSPEWSLIGCDIISDGEALTVRFLDASFTFHAQWLDDANCDQGPSRTASTAFCQKPAVARILKTHTSGEGVGVAIDVSWLDGSTSSYPAIWLRIMGPLVGRQGQSSPQLPTPQSRGWMTDSLKIPSFDYQSIFSDTAQTCDATAASIMDEILMSPNTGIVQITGLPAPDVESERDKTNTLVTQVLKKLFGAVFQHPRRSGDKTFNVSSHHEEDVEKAAGLPNYDTAQILLPHVDHAHYQHPIHVQGWYGLEGESENTFVSGLQALDTLRQESPDLFEPLTTAPMSLGRVVHYYDPPLYQAVVDTPVTMYPGTTTTAQIQRLRWHPHLTGSILAPFEAFPLARAAHAKLQEILRRDSHQLKIVLKPGDLYLWNNFTVLHGRERVLSVPRTGVGQTVPEQVVADRYRALKIARLRECIDEKWLVHMPVAQLYQLGRIVVAS